MTERSIEGGMDALNKGSKPYIRSTVSMILAFGCLNTCTTTAGFPFARPAFRRSSNESSTVAISDRRMGRSEERRVGKEWRYRVSPYHIKKKTMYNDILSE